MIVRIFKAGRSRGESPVNYLLSDTDHTGAKRSANPEVIEGHPTTTVQIINGIHRKHKYVSGVMAFRNNEQPTRKQLHECIDAFKATVAPGLRADQYNSLWVLHQDKGNTELHFVFPMTELTTGRRLNIHPPGPKNLALYQAFGQVMNESLGYQQVTTDPMKIAKQQFKFRNASSGERSRHIDLLQKELTHAIQSGAIANRGDACQFMEEELGITITRRGADYLSVKLPGAKKAIRLKGPLFAEGADYQAIASEAKHSDGRLTPEQFKGAVDQLDQLVQERGEFNLRAYQPRLPRGGARSSHPTPQWGKSDITTNTQGGEIMKFSDFKRLLLVIYAKMQEIDQERKIDRIQADHKRMTMVNMKTMRAHATPKAGNSLQDAFNELSMSIGDIDIQINGEIHEMTIAPDAASRAAAQKRLAALNAQKLKLQQEMVRIKVMLLNQQGKEAFP